LIKQDIVHQVIERTGLPRTKAESAVDTVSRASSRLWPQASASNCADSRLQRPCPQNRNWAHPRTGTEVNITPGKAVRFKPGKELHTIATAEAPKS